MKILLLWLFAGIFWGSVLMSSDTIETFEKGFTDLEYYHGEKLTQVREFCNEVHVGAGILSNFSFHASLSNEKIAKNIISSYTFGFIFTPFDSEHLDFDLYSEVADDFSYFAGYEINYDTLDNLKDKGLYIRNEFYFNDGYNNFNLLLGVYKTFFDKLQILAEAEFEYDEKVSFISFNIGLNYSYWDSLELINQISVDDKKDFTLMAGFLATLP